MVETRFKPPTFRLKVQHANHQTTAATHTCTAGRAISFWRVITFGNCQKQKAVHGCILEQCIYNNLKK